MWAAVAERFPSGMVWLCTLLSFLIPFSVYKVNKLMHKLGDAPWNQKQSNADGDNKSSRK